ncbi:MAG: choice-of-anchor Q domain-containing protein [Bryobacteraceae bacterium]
MRSRICTMLLLLGAAAANIVLAAVPAGANLWVDTSGGTCTRQATPGAYVDSQACSSMQTAQSAAKAGDIVIIKNGTYGGQSLGSGQLTSAVSYYAESAGKVLLTGNLSINIDKVHVLGVISAGTGQDARNDLSVMDSTSTAFTDIVVDGWQGRSAFIASSGVTVSNSEIGNGYGCNASHQEDAVQFWGWGSSLTNIPTKFNFLNNVVHDWVADSNGACSNGRHVDGFQNYPGSSGVLIDGNIFYNNATSNIMTEGISGSWVIQNNYFGAPYVAGNNLVIGRGDCSGVVIQYNVMDFNSVNNDAGCTGSYIVRGNIFPRAVSTCGAGVADHNIFPASGGSTCGSSAKRCTPAWVLAPPAVGGVRPDPTLLSTDTCARDAGNPTGYPTRDFFGTPRPQGSAADAGPFEYPAAGSGPAPPTLLYTVIAGLYLPTYQTH